MWRLLFGMQLDNIPSLYSFWHSFSTDYPGINISGYSDTEVDINIEKLDKEFGSKERDVLYKEIVEKISKDQPIIPLYSPFYIQKFPKNLKRFSQGEFITKPEERFKGVEDWYIESEEVLNIFLK